MEDVWASRLEHYFSIKVVESVWLACLLDLQFLLDIIWI